MKALHKFCRLSRADRWLLIKAMLLLAGIRLALWIVPFQTLWRMIGHITGTDPESHQANEAVLNRVAWAVTVASCRLPKLSCLTQALTAQILLCQSGQPAQLRIGLVKSQDGQLQGHAWVICEGRVVIGGVADLSRYLPMPLPEGGGL